MIDDHTIIFQQLHKRILKKSIFVKEIEWQMVFQQWYSMFVSVTNFMGISSHPKVGNTDIHAFKNLKGLSAEFLAKTSNNLICTCTTRGDKEDAFEEDLEVEADGDREELACLAFKWWFEFAGVVVDDADDDGAVVWRFDDLRVRILDECITDPRVWYSECGLHLDLIGIVVVIVSWKNKLRYWVSSPNVHFDVVKFFNWWKSSGFGNFVSLILFTSLKICLVWIIRSSEFSFALR